MGHERDTWRLENRDANWQEYLIKTAKEHIHSPVSTCLSHGPQVLTDLEKKRKIEFRNCWEIWSCYRKKGSYEVAGNLLQIIVVMELLEIWMNNM